MADKQGWRVSLSLTAVGILGALLGYSVQHFLSLERERSRAFEDRQSAAYVAFLSAFEISRMARDAEEAGDPKKAAELRAEYEREAGAAGRRIAVYGDKEVVKAMAEWYRAYRPGDPPPCDKELNAELTIWDKMRDALLVRDQRVSQDNLAAITVRRLCSPATRP